MSDSKGAAVNRLALALTPFDRYGEVRTDGEIGKTVAELLTSALETGGKDDRLVMTSTLLQGTPLASPTLTPTNSLDDGELICTFQAIALADGCTDEEVERIAPGGTFARDSPSIGARINEVITSLTVFRYGGRTDGEVGEWFRNTVADCVIAEPRGPSEENRILIDALCNAGMSVPGLNSSDPCIDLKVEASLVLVMMTDGCTDEEIFDTLGDRALDAAKANWEGCCKKIGIRPDR